MQITLKLKGERSKSIPALPRPLERRILNAMQERKFAVGSDYDGTMVQTDEAKRSFPPFKDDKSKVIEPMGALGILGIPIAVLTGNTVPYIDGLCVNGYRSWLDQRGAMSAMAGFSVYYMNSTYLKVFNGEGGEVKRPSEEYAAKYRLPRRDIAALHEAFKMALGEEIPGEVFMAERPMVARPTSIASVNYKYGPEFQNREGVQISWVAVPSEYRKQVILAALRKLPPDIIANYRFELGGHYSIDITHKRVAKCNGTRHFREKTGARVIAYFGDSVFRRRLGGFIHVGNDLPVVKDRRAIVFAVNPDQNKVPNHERIVRAGAGPDATRAWLTWLLAQFISVRLASEHLPAAEKVRMIDAVVASGLVEDIEIA